MSVRSLRRGTLAAKAAAVGKTFPVSGGNTYRVGANIEVWSADPKPPSADGIWFHDSWSATGGTIWLMPVSGTGANSVYRGSADGWIVGDTPKHEGVDGRAQWRSNSVGLVDRITVGPVLADPG